MTPAQIKEMEKLAEASIDRNMYELHEADARVRKYKAGYIAAMEKAKVLEKAIEAYLDMQKFLAAPYEDNCVSSSDFKEALKQWRDE